MQNFVGSLIRRHVHKSSNITHFKTITAYSARMSPQSSPVCSISEISNEFAAPHAKKCFFGSLSYVGSPSRATMTHLDFQRGAWMSLNNISNNRSSRLAVFQGGAASRPFFCRCMTTVANPVDVSSQGSPLSTPDVAPRIKFKRLDKTARNIMQIIDKEAVEEVKSDREIPDIKPGHIVQLKVVVPENKRRVSIVKGTVIARRNAGISTTFRIRRLVAGVGVESLFHLYSPNIKEIKILEKKKVRRAKLYYLRDRMNALKKR
ncbi:hypothetical protein HS088_TW08G00309 [Tripterygium wilfordii]|uniref:Uncharacterized protein n=1 Tax=Tripterygium wilfordii TaxID=458696 RepID=A0A7J7DBI4_TRIWF|nr:50S ribosomal protein L19-1, chloroplastic-like [Tripterygium wilfordii]KAF5743722.1 hypothetical protein HS088_TW08G00309 [Tripterygium wilfordii]